MKKGYKKLLIFQGVMLTFIIINSVFYTYLKGYGLCIFLFISLIFLKKALGFEKDKNQNKKDILLETFIFLLVFFLIYFSSGIFIGFASSAKYSIYELFNTIIPLILGITLTEYLRYTMLCKSELNKITTIFTIVIFILLDTTNYLLNYDFTTGYNIFKFIAMIFIPSICKNIAYSYVARKSGFKTLIFYSMVIGIYPYILPIVPNVSEYLYSLISMILPIIYMFRISDFYETEEQELEEQKKNTAILKLMPLYAVLLFVICIYSGYFRYWIIVIASGSMTPEIQIGDLVLIDQKYNKSLLEKGQIIAYKNNNTIIVHRIEEKTELNGSTYYITKGDANHSNDNLLVDDEMIVGLVKTEIPYLGLPTVWIHETLK